ncbi:MAG TPA: hypothetical protein VFB12_18960 [Ktedonobacteraceae bacterium]|nr:hypothetical protein [Ktedonobacteraceae bacterium]
MIDTFMALWNMGCARKAAGVFSAVLLICICLSLLLVTNGTPGGWPFFRGEGQHSGNSVGRLATSTATVDTMSRDGLTATATASLAGQLPCTPESVSVTPTSSWMRGGNGQSNDGSGMPQLNATPDPVAHPTPSVIAVASATATKTVIATATAQATVTPTAQATPISTVKPTHVGTAMATRQATGGIKAGKRRGAVVESTTRRKEMVAEAASMQAGKGVDTGANCLSR